MRFITVVCGYPVCSILKKSKIDSVLIGLFVSTILFPYGLSADEIIKQPSQQHPTAFAVIVDEQTYHTIGPAVDQYREAVEQDGLSAYLVINDWQDPDEVRRVIIKLANQQPPLEGVALVGEIPIPMIRDAQHLTSAFKMVQDNPERFPFIRSSVPSDRFYDDFDLKFQFIRQDSAHPLLFYYSLQPDSPQRIERDIYSGRIKAPGKGRKQYRLLRDYLIRTAEQKRTLHPINHLMVVTGHGYHSESLTSWAWEWIALREQFPHLYMPGGRIDALYHEMSEELEQTIFTKLQNRDLDIAIFHAHGSENVQYLLGNESASSVSQNISAIKYYLRNKMRRAKQRNKSPEKIKERYIKRYNVPASWFEGAFCDSIAIADSIADDKKDIYLKEIRNLSPEAKFIMLDECFNGAFIHPSYVAGEYVFGKGHTAAAAANSVNVLQDIWANEQLGLLNYGVRIGQWHKTRNYLESHIIGDPTFRFENMGNQDISRFIGFENKNMALWQNLLNNKDASIRVLAIEKIFNQKGKNFEDRLTDFYETDPASIVRLQALKCLARLRSEQFEKILFKSIDDPAELIRRFTAMWMGDIGKVDYLEPLVETLITDPAKRVRNSARSAVEKIGAKRAAVIARDRVERLPRNVSQSDLLKKFQSMARHNSEWLNDELLPTIRNDTLSVKKRIRAVRTFRNYRFQQAVPSLIEIAMDSRQDPKLRRALLEALGWFTFNWRRDTIVNTCERILSQKNAPDVVKREALKTKKRLLAGANNPLTP